jgi:ubiquinone/menaquinone biosynthesis C-methylase UbiE
MKMSPFEKRFVNAARHGRRVAERAEALLARAQPRSGQRYLDVGCGVGWAAAHVAERHGLDVTGVDVDPEQIRLARERSAGLTRLDFRVMDATRLELPDCSFDIVAMSNVTHHVPEWEAALTEAIRVLQVGGALIYSDFVLPGWLASASRLLAHGGSGLPTRRALQVLLERQRLEPIHATVSPLRLAAVWRRSV